MRIEPTGNTTPLARIAQPAEAQVPAQGETMATGDSVQIGQARDVLVRAQQAVQTSPAVRSDLVQAIRSAIESGSYHLDATALASALLDRI